MKKCVIIINPQSGKKKKITTYEEFYDRLRKYGYDTEIILTKAKGHAKNIMEELDDDIDLVISAGGDGTLNEIVAGNMRRRKKLTVAPLPLGSTNDVGGMYGLDNNVYNNLEKILKGEVRKVDICYINNTPFVYVACFGDYIDMAYSTPRYLKEKYGKIAYILYGIKQFRPKINTHEIKYKVDGKEYEGTYSFIFISNSSRIAGQPDIYYDIKLDDNLFEVALANVKNFQEMAKLIVQITTIDAKKIPNITYYQTNNFEIEFKEPLNTSWCIDGEEYETDTKVFKFYVDQKMKMLIPKENINELFKETKTRG